MYLLITKKKGKNDKIYRSAKIAEAYKTPEGKSRQTIIQNLGPVKSIEDEIKFREIVKNMKKGKEFIDINSMNFITAKSYGIYYVVSELMKKFKLDEILKTNLQIGKHQFDVFQIIKALIINKLENPLSKNKAFQYIQKDYPFQIECKKDHLYSAMDILEKQKEKIELEIFQNLKDTLKLDLENAHYDITSSYFEGSKCEIATYGYSRDHRPDREQIVIGLVLIDGIPVYHKVFKGNTQDKTTVLEVTEYLKKKFKLQKPTLIGDRGMLTENILEELEKDNTNYILGFSKTGNKITENLIQNKIDLLKDKKTNAIIIKEEEMKISEKNIQTRRYVLCIDKNTQIEQLETLENVKEYISTNLTKLRIQFEKSKRMKWENLITHIKKITNRNKKLFNIIYDHDKQDFTFELNNEWYEREKNASGKFIIVTNTDKPALEVLKTYKELNLVESSFNCIKNQLELRPINHYKTNRVEAHVFICILALLIRKIMDRFLKDISSQSAVEELKRLMIGEFKIGKIKKINLTDITIEQKNILQQLKLIIPMI